MSNSLQYLYDKPTINGVYKQQNQDFMVKEDLGFPLDGTGEHVFVYLRKNGYNTLYLVDVLAKFAGISSKLISYAGLKDRNAITEQWFSLHLPGKETPDFSKFELENCEILTVTRNQKKLKIGALKGNYFELTLRDIDDQPGLTQRLEKVQADGVPNYFGEQRFGIDNSNVTQAKLWAKGEIVVRDRKKRSFYLSAARSAIFNDIVSERMVQGYYRQVMLGDALQLADRGSWFVAQAEEMSQLQQRLDNGELNITAPLAGDKAFGSRDDALAFEENCITQNWSDVMQLLRKERLENARRAIILKPKSMTWQWQDPQTLTLAFWLPSGSYATSVLRELVIEQ